MRMIGIELALKHIIMRQQDVKIGELVRVIKGADGYRVGEVLPVTEYGTTCLFLGGRKKAIYPSKVVTYMDFNNYLKELN